MLAFPRFRDAAEWKQGPGPRQTKTATGITLRETQGLFWQRKRFLIVLVFSSWSQAASGFENSGHGHHLSYILLEQSQFKMMSHVTPKELLHL